MNNNNNNNAWLYSNDSTVWFWKKFTICPFNNASNTVNQLRGGEVMCEGRVQKRGRFEEGRLHF